MRPRAAQSDANLSSEGYAYDAEGNRTARFRDTNAGGTLSVGDTDVTVYGYDQRNRLVAVSHVNDWTSTQAAGLAAFMAQGTALPGSDLELRYTYDYTDRRIRRMIDADGIAGAGQESVSFAAYAGDARTLEVARTDTLIINGSGQVLGFLGQVVQRNFYGNGADEILAVDQVSWNGTTPTTSTFWTLTDHQDSVRDIVSGNAGSLGQVVEHRQYDSFGRIVRRTNGPQATAPATAGVGIDFGYTGRPLEARTGLSDNRARWYEPATGRFINEDPSGFKGGDANLFRYVGNDPLNQVDPSGLAAKWASYAGTSSMPTGRWGVVVQQNATLPKAASPSVSAMAYASLVRQPPQAAVAASMIGSMPAMTATVSGTRPIVTPVSQSVSGQAYSGVSASPAAGSSFMTRVGGAFSALGGLAQTAVGVSTVAASGIGTAMSGGAAAPGAIPLGFFGAGVAAHGIDQVWSGLRTVWTGSNQRPYAAQGLDFVTRNPTASDWLNGGAGMLATAGAGFATRSLAGAAARTTSVTPRGLDWTIVGKTAETRIAHVSQHGANNLQKPIHGVFYGNPAQVADDAWSIAQRSNVAPVRVGGVDIYLVPRPNSGFAGGFAGQGQNLDTVTILTQPGTNKVITAFPGNGLPTPRP